MESKLIHACDLSTPEEIYERINRLYRQAAPEYVEGDEELNEGSVLISWCYTRMWPAN